MQRMSALFFFMTTFLILTHATVQHVRGQQIRERVDPLAPLSAVVALTHTDGQDVVAFVKQQVERTAFGKSLAQPFPLSPGTSDNMRVLDGLRSQVVVKWLDPLASATDIAAPRFGANNDYIAYFGDGWDADWQGDVPGSPPQFHGSGRAGWLWVNHEYVGNMPPTQTTAPMGQHLILASFLQAHKILQNDITAQTWPQAALDTYIQHHKRQLGGSWLRIVQEEKTGAWSVDRTASAVRFDATDKTRIRVTGQSLRARDHDDAGKALPPGVVVGILADCSGGQTPWGTIITAEENHQFYYGDVEVCWGPQQKFIPGNGCDPGTRLRFPDVPSQAAVFGMTSQAAQRHNPEHYGYLVEIDPRSQPDVFYTSTANGGTGVGQRKLGSMGRARWENAAIVVDEEWKLRPNQPIVLYAGNDRPSGRIYKWVSHKPYTADMTRAQIRALLDDGTLFVAHFAGLDNTTGNTLLGGQSPTEKQRGRGRWIRLSVESKDIAPNANVLEDTSKTVGTALTDAHWNGMGGFDTDDDVRRALFTASAKIGVMELNRPEDLEWNPKDPSGAPRLYVAFTNHMFGTQLDQDGRLLDAGVAEVRSDQDGAIFALQEADPSNPSLSQTFTYFQVWKGSVDNDTFAAANPDNLMMDREGGVWFGTDGNFRRTGGKSADSLYYLHLDPNHRAGKPSIVTSSFGKAFRVASVPSDAEATGPAFNADMTTIFLSVQHPGEYVVSTWPQER